MKSDGFYAIFFEGKPETVPDASDLVTPASFDTSIVYKPVSSFVVEDIASWQTPSGEIDVLIRSLGVINFASLYLKYYGIQRNLFIN